MCRPQKAAVPANKAENRDQAKCQISRTSLRSDSRGANAKLMITHGGTGVIPTKVSAQNSAFWAFGVHRGGAYSHNPDSITALANCTPPRCSSRATRS